jgi:predicted HAD superfamily Cof-like phosphohydrolase
MTKSSLDQVREFHETYGAAINDEPHIADTDLNAFRVRLLQEELDELKEALADGDAVETLDALTDLQYVLDGAFLSLGMHGVKDTAFAEVHRSNMSKLGEDGKPILRESDGKVLKGPNYFKPDLNKFVQKTDKAA